jgi:putative nucleotidyltransferase with HDIG domain
MSWLFRKKKAVAEVPANWKQPAPAISILDGDESVTTPVEASTLGKMARLCPFSPVAISVLQLFDQEEVSTQKIANMLQSDPVLAAETLAYVNSPLFAQPASITELHGAILVLGADNTKRLAATLAMRGMLKSAPKPGVTRRLWRHSMAAGLIAAELAPLYGLDKGLANTAGVLHDIGRVGLLAKDGEEYAQLVLQLHENVDAILAAESTTCGMDHCAAGEYLGRTWKLPSAFLEAIALHHHPKTAAGMAGLIHAACGLADDMTYTAISHRSSMTIAERIALCIPEGLRERALPLMTDLAKRIDAKVDELDF